MRIGQLAPSTDVPTSTLRYYERAGLLPPPGRTDAGYRDYPDDAVGRVAFVRNAQSAGLTLAQVGEVLAIRDDERPPCDHVAELVDDCPTDIDRPLNGLRRARDELRGVRRRREDLDPADRAADGVCSAIVAAR